MCPLKIFLQDKSGVCVILRQGHIIEHKSSAVRGCLECNSAHFGTIMSEFDTMKGDLECNSGYC